MPKGPEHDEQVAFFQGVEWSYNNRPDFIRRILFSVPNGAWLGGSSKLARAALMQRMKAEGFQNGVSDILYLQPRGPYNCLAIEMKAPDRRNEKGGGLTADQSEFLQALAAAGGCCDVCYTSEEALAVFNAYMGFEPLVEIKGNEKIAADEMAWENAV